ncbi:MAG: LysM domain-containing protein [Candidatus Electrothrix sp. AW1]|nr:LysM domain-containing protein [Candidatus Electrothrix gigas]
MSVVHKNVSSKAFTSTKTKVFTSIKIFAKTCFLQKRSEIIIIIVGIVYMPTDKSFFLSLKKRSAALWHESIVNYSIYTVRPDDYLIKIAHKYGVSVDDIVSANKRRYPSLAKNPDSILPGWRLKIPRQQ